MRRFALALVSVVISTNLGCHFTNRCSDSQTDCGRVHVGCAPQGSASACSSANVEQSQDCGFGLFGKAFCHPRLSEGTAFLPWQYSYNLCLATSQLSNTILGGDPDESLSSRFGRAQQDGVATVRYGLVPVTNLMVGPDHCQRCIEYDERREKELWAW